MTSPSDEKRICAMFDSFCKKVSRNYLRDLEWAEERRDTHYAGLQRRASHHHHVFAGAGGIPLYFGKRDLGETEAVCGRQGQPCLQLLPRLPERGGRADGGGAGGGGDRAAHLPAFHAGADALRHRKIPHRQKHPDAHGEGDMAAQDGGEHTFQREVQRRRPPAEMLHGGLPFQEAEGERRGGAAVLCGGQP